MATMQKDLTIEHDRLRNELSIAKKMNETFNTTITKIDLLNAELNLLNFLNSNYEFYSSLFDSRK